jgi:hypothetical protein
MSNRRTFSSILPIMDRRLLRCLGVEYFGVLVEDLLDSAALPCFSRVGWGPAWLA